MLLEYTVTEKRTFDVDIPKLIESAKKDLTFITNLNIVNAIYKNVNRYLEEQGLPIINDGNGLNYAQSDLVFWAVEKYLHIFE
jgi:hypothetical protein